MKLVYVAFAFSYAILANARSAEYGECTNSRSFRGVIKSGRNSTPEQYNANFDINLYKYLQAQQQNGNANEACAQRKEECAALLEGLDLESFRDKTGGSRECGKQADEVIDNLLGCALCERLNELEEADSYCAEDSNSMACVSRSQNQQHCQETGATAGSYLGCLTRTAKETELAAEAVKPQDDGQNDDKCAEGDQSLECAGKSKASTIVIKLFNRCTGKVWNIVVSGGPEYCRDMFPRYPRVIFGKMRPGHPNYEAVVEIRDACQALQNIVKQTRCFCLYVNWGCPEYPRNCSGGWKKKCASAREANICYYFSNLKGTGVYKPKKRPSDTQCGKGKKPGNGNRPSGAQLSVLAQAQQKCKKFKRQKNRYKKCIAQQKKALSG